MLRHRTSALFAVATASTVLLAGCDEGTDPAAHEPVAGDQIAVLDNDFEPSHLEVTAGETVTWVWEGRAPHDVVGDGFDSGVLQEGTFSHTFDDPGTYDYDCTLHRGMDGRITVVDG